MKPSLAESTRRLPPLTRRQAVMAALETNSDLPQDNPAVVSVLPDITTLSAQLDERVKALSGDATAEKRKQLNAEAEELRARVLLAKHETTVLQEIDRKKRLAAYEQSKSDTATQVITRKSSEVTRAVVTQKLKNTFQEELQGPRVPAHRSRVAGSRRCGGCSLSQAGANARAGR